MKKFYFFWDSIDGECKDFGNLFNMSNKTRKIKIAKIKCWKLSLVCWTVTLPKFLCWWVSIIVVLYYSTSFESNFYKNKVPVRQSESKVDISGEEKLVEIWWLLRLLSQIKGSLFVYSALADGMIGKRQLSAFLSSY